MSQYLQTLNDVQHQAVTHPEGPALVIAGPGSGKTRVLTFRIAWLIEQGIPPWQILALTFTNKAAREMKERISAVVGEKTRDVWAGTFHSIFARILRVEGEKLGYESTFTIYDSDDSKSVISSIIKEMNLDPKQYNSNAVRSRISSAKSKVLSPEQYMQNDDLMTQDRMSGRSWTGEIYKRYVTRCKQSGAMDFDDLLYQLFLLFNKFPDTLKKYQARFQHVLVDEFQDTNHLQYQILRQLVAFPESKENVMVVGDDAQSIYAFRGATIENILNFENDFSNLKVYKLEQNYRSTEHIVQAANEVINYNKNQIKKKIWTEKGDGNKIRLIKTVSDAEEGNRIADAILEQKNRFHLSNRDIAILYRTNAQSRIFEEHLRRHNITYKVFGGMSFYQRKEVKDLIAYLRLAVNPRDDEALKRVINYPRRGIGATSLTKLQTAANATGSSLWEAIQTNPIGGRTGNSLNTFVNMINDFTARAITLNAFDIATYVAAESGLMKSLKSDDTPEGINRLENVNALLDGVKEFTDSDEFTEVVAVDDKSLASYLQNIALVTDFDEEGESGDYVTLMSVHAAKGLEFPSIFIVGLEEKLFPSFMSMDSKEGLDEERRLFYVAITRAQQFLTLSYASSRYRYGQLRYNEPSRFLEEITPIHLEGMETMKPKYEPQRAQIQGNFKPVVSHKKYSLKADPDTFIPTSSDQIQVGMQVLHIKFGEGKVLSIDGNPENRVATIFFKDIDNPQRRIMLRFAKLQVLN